MIQQLNYIKSTVIRLLLLIKSIHGSKLQGRVVGGFESRSAEWPWMISMHEYDVVTDSEIFRCGASLIGQFWALTAAHCVYRKNPLNYRLRIGETNEFPRGRKVIPIDEFIWHPFYRHGKFTDDIALIRFAKPVTFDTDIYPVSLPLSRDDDHAGKIATVIGWGALYERPKLPPKYLNHVKLPVMSNLKCRMVMQATKVFRGKKFHHSWLCAGYLKGGKDACEGDSGGPLVIRENGHWTLVGIVSSGFGCARPYHPGIYARVSQFLEWIDCVVTNYDILDEYYHYCRQAVIR